MEVLAIVLCKRFCARKSLIFVEPIKLSFSSVDPCQSYAANFVLSFLLHKIGVNCRLDNFIDVKVYEQKELDICFITIESQHFPIDSGTFYNIQCKVQNENLKHRKKCETALVREGLPEQMV